MERLQMPPPTAPGPALLVQSTPIKTGIFSTAPFTTNQKFRIESCTAMGKEMKKFLVGPMPADKFLDDFFPVSGLLPGFDTVPHFKNNNYYSTLAAERETAAYAPFVESTLKFLPGYRIVNSSSLADRNPYTDFPFQIKPDVSVYRADSGCDVVTDSSLAEVFIEFKWSANDDPFAKLHFINRPDGDPQRSFIHETQLGMDTLGQITSYAAAQLGSQFRTHLYSIIIVKGMARILRWDRSGAIVTEAIDYNNSPLLAEFFRRYSKAPPGMRGIDESVLTRGEAIAARRVLAAFQPDDKAPLIKLEIPSNGGAPRYFITPVPRATFYTPPGRATRGFHAYDISRGALCFLKDTWRIDLPDIQAEGLTYKTLNEAHVRNIPQCIAFGDISTPAYHSTKTCLYNAAVWACPTDAHFIPHRHYRLVLDVIGHSLLSFKSSYEMVSAVRDAIIAHQDAYNAKILHRDFSPGNIIIGGDRRGLLTDWDLSKPLSIVPETPRRATRTGTWQFMSGKLIAREGPQDFRDDLESTFYILLWVGLMYSKCSNHEKVAGFLHNVLDPQPRDSDGHSTYTTKPEFLKGRDFLSQVRFPGRPQFDKLLLQLATQFAVRYEEPPSPTHLATANRILAELEERKEEGTDVSDSESLYLTIPAVSFTCQNDDLKDHTRTIKYFDDALADRMLWPLVDGAEKQDIHSNTMSSREPVLKTGWNSTLVTLDFQKGTDDIGSKDEETGSDAMVSDE